MKRNLFITSVVVEILGIAVIASGITVELMLGAEIGYVLITGGSLIVAGGGILFSKVVRRGK